MVQVVTLLVHVSSKIIDCRLKSIEGDRVRVTLADGSQQDALGVLKDADLIIDTYKDRSLMLHYHCQVTISFLVCHGWKRFNHTLNGVRRVYRLIIKDRNIYFTPSVRIDSCQLPL